MRLNHYRIMWLFVIFDLPVLTKPERRRAARFRKYLIEDGFIMKQFSVYTRHCPSAEAANKHENWVKRLIPPEGHVSIFRITDKQFGEMVNFSAGSTAPQWDQPKQLELF
ncbi:CRISPR-associated endonuclease Cas2 [bacterium]|nr:CRISPR-associated endonuclease Cas2 [bacterium]